MDMQYLTMRWFTLSSFNKDKLKLFHSLEKAINTKNLKYKNLCWYKQTESFLKQEFKKLFPENKNMQMLHLQNFNKNLQNFLKQNSLNPEMLLSNINFIHKCDCIICNKIHADDNTSDIITSLP